jgi:hypothetical protein
MVAGIGGPLTLLSIELLAFAWLSSENGTTGFFKFSLHSASLYLIAACVFLLLFVWMPLDVNFTAPHRHYRRKLAEAFLIQRDASGNIGNVDIPLSKTNLGSFGPYHLINAALNVPASKNPALQGRFADFFLFSKEYCGSPIFGYHRTGIWEAEDSSLSLATAMAVSGAAATPLMGLETKSHIGFWMTLLNIRLGYWVRRPKELTGAKTPGPLYLARELIGAVDGNGRFLNVTDGGHIENLGLYELLRRRCKFMVAIDGEFDPEMTFHAIANLQRMALIDLGVRIDIDLEELRLDSDRLSR